MDYTPPRIADLGDIGSHTFINPGGDNKGTSPGIDPFNEISVKDNGGS